WAPVDIAGAGHPTRSLGLAALSAPALGGTLRLSFPMGAGFGLLMLGAGPVQAPLFTVPPGILCDVGHLYTDLSVIIPVVRAPIALAVPDDPSLAATALVLQAGALQPGNCLRLTDALHVTLQPR